MNFILSNLFFCPQRDPIIGLEGVSTSRTQFKPVGGGEPGFAPEPPGAGQCDCCDTNTGNPTFIGGIPTIFYRTIETVVDVPGYLDSWTTTYPLPTISQDETYFDIINVNFPEPNGPGSACRSCPPPPCIGGYTNTFSNPQEKIYVFPVEDSNLGALLDTPPEEPYFLPYPSFNSNTAFEYIINSPGYPRSSDWSVGYYGQSVGSAFRNLSVSILNHVNYQKTRYRIKHYPTLTNYLKVWVRKVKNLYTLNDGTWELTQGNVMENLTPYVWQDNSAPILSPTEEDIIISPVVEVLPNLGERGYLQIYKWSYLSSYEPGVGDPNGFPPTC